MPLTRHLYSVDEVHAALKYATTRNDATETLFWCRELLLSGFVSEAISTLFEAWVWHKGPFSLSWLLLATSLSSDEVSEECILQAAYSLSRIPYTQRDNSLWNILALTSSSEMPERVTPKSPPLLPSTEEKEQFMIRAMYQGKAYSAWWMSLHLSSDRVWELVRWYACHLTEHSDSYRVSLDMLLHYDSLLGYFTEEYDTVIRCLAVLSVCLSPSQQAQSWKKVSVGEHKNGWPTGTRASRIYSIPNACLYGETRRGCMKWTESTVSTLNQLVHASFWEGCPFWEEAVSAYQEKGKWTSEEAKEAFYVRYFPDDVPDEWSKAEKEKSHGAGLLGPTECPMMLKYVRSFLSSWARLAWNTTPRIHAFLAGKEWTHPVNIVTLFPLPGPMMSCHPVCRRLRV